jgi:hypothetical protein
MQKTATKIEVHDYGTNCSDCERYRKMGDICMLEHGKKFQWEYCRDFVPLVVLPDYKELMQSVRADRAEERRKEKERKEKEKKKKLKERKEREELRKKKRRSMLRKRRERLKKRQLKDLATVEKKAKKVEIIQDQSSALPAIDPAKKIRKPKKSENSGLENAENGVVRERNRVARKRSDVANDE